jgi:hypothetical protein
LNIIGTNTVVFIFLLFFSPGINFDSLTASIAAVLKSLLAPFSISASAAFLSSSIDVLTRTLPSILSSH